MKKILGVFLSFSLMLTMFSTTVNAEENVVADENIYSMEELNDNSQSESIENELSKDEQVKESVENEENLTQEENVEKPEDSMQEDISEAVDPVSEMQTNEKTNERLAEPTQECAVSVTIDGTTTNYATFKEALERSIEGNEIVVTLHQDVDFTNEGIYSKKTQTNGIYLEIKTEGANVVLDLNGHNVVNHFKNPNGSFPARGFSATLKKGGSFKVLNNSSTTSKFDVERLGQVSSGNSDKIIEFTFGNNIETNTKDLSLKYVVSKYSDFYLGFNGGFKGLQADGSYNFYTSASEAIKNSTDNTATLVNDYTGNDGFSASSGTKGTVDLNNKTFTTLSTAFNLLYSDVDITVKNGTVNCLNENCNENTPNVGFIGDPAYDVSNVILTLDHVDIVSNYYNGIDLHGTDTDLHLNLINSTLTMQRSDSYGVYIPSKDSSVTLNNSAVKAGTGIAVKGGTLNVIDSNIQSNGVEVIPNEGGASGFEETGDAIYIDGSYNFPIDVNIKNSEVTSENAKAVRDLFVDETSNNTNIVTKSGTFSSNVLKYVPENKASLRADSYYYVGTEDEVIKEAENAKEIVEILTGVDSIVVQEGVKVINNSGSNITVNGDVVKDNQTVVIDKIPTATVTYSNDGHWTNQDVTVTIKVSEPIQDIQGWTKVDGQTFTKVFADNARDTLTITDMTGNSIQVEVNVKNIDKYAPEIRGLNDIILVQGETFDPLEGIVAYDDQCGEIKDVKVTSSIDTNVVGVYELAYTVSDLAGNITTVKRTVTVNPKEETLNHAPVIKAEDITLTVGDEFDPRKNVSAMDEEDGDLTNVIEIIENTVDTSKVGTYQITYKVTDQDGASFTKTIKVVVNGKEEIIIPNPEEPNPEKPNTNEPNTNKQDNDKASVKTGDNANVGLYTSLLAMSGLCIIMLVVWKRKKMTD